MKCMSGSCWPTYPIFLTLPETLKWSLEKKYRKWALFRIFVTIFFVKCYNKSL